MDTIHGNVRRIKNLDGIFQQVQIKAPLPALFYVTSPCRFT